MSAMFQPASSITINNATAALEEGLRAIAAGQTAFDFSAVRVVDSAAVAVMLAWQRAVQKRGSKLAFEQVPGNLQSLVDLYDVAALLHPTAGATSRADLPHH